VASSRHCFASAENAIKAKATAMMMERVRCIVASLQCGLVIDLDRRGREPREYNIRSKVNTSAFPDGVLLAADDYYGYRDHLNKISEDTSLTFACRGLAVA
jgi:hypothetical protein